LVTTDGMERQKCLTQFEARNLRQVIFYLKSGTNLGPTKLTLLTTLFEYYLIYPQVS